MAIGPRVGRGGKRLFNFARDFSSARFGDRYTYLYGAIFALVALFLVVEVVDKTLLRYTQNGIPTDFLRSYNAQVDDLLAENENTHPHLVGFPIFVRLFRLTSLNVWILYPLMLAMVVPALWMYLGSRYRIPLLMVTVVTLTIWRSPLVSHVNLIPNSDLLVTVGLIALFFYIKHRPGRFISYGLIFFGIMLVHERAVVLAPAVVLWAAYCWRGEPSNPLGLSRRDYLKAAAPIVLALVAFYVYKKLFYVYFPAQMPLRRLDFVQQVKQFLRIESAANLEGGPFHYVVSSQNWTAWGLYYFAFVPLAIGALMRKQFFVVAIALAIHLGTISQLLVAQDVGRLTGFLYINLLLLAIFAVREWWPLQKATALFFIVGFVIAFQADFERVGHRILNL